MLLAFVIFDSNSEGAQCDAEQLEGHPGLCAMTPPMLLLRVREGNEVVSDVVAALHLAVREQCRSVRSTLSSSMQQTLHSQVA